MTLDLKLSEEEIEKEFSDFEQVGLSRKLKHSCPNESSLGRFRQDWLKKVMSLPDLILGMYLEAKDAVDYAMENVNNHGGERISVELRYSESKIAVSVSDNGKGFDVKEKVRDFLKGKKHYRLRGNGFTGMNESSARVGFSPKGNKTLIFYEGEEDKSFFAARAQDYREKDRIYKRVHPIFV